ncbi:MAG: HAMP domain-containing protein [Zetaproteobacteria bacterium]|nr:HAMP domain-containing protein [Zetaproteobacteria bacterium]
MLGMRKKSRIFLVNRDFQVRYARAAIMVGIVSTVVTAFVILCPLYFFEILRIPRFLPWPILSAMGCAAILNVFLVALMSLYATHRVAGPLFSLLRAIRALGLMQLDTRLKLREGDELHFIARNFNEMAEQMEQMVASDHLRLMQWVEVLEESSLAEPEKAALLNDMKDEAYLMQQRLGRIEDSDEE